MNTGPTHGEIQRAEQHLALLRRQIAATETLAAAVAELVGVVAQLAPKSGPYPQAMTHALLEGYRAHLDAADTGDKAVAVWVRSARLLHEADVAADAWEYLRQRVRAVEPCLPLEAVDHWVRTRTTRPAPPWAPTEGRVSR